MTSGENSPPTSGLSLTPHETEADSNKPVTPRSRTDELLANSSLSLVPVEEQAATEQNDDTNVHVEEQLVVSDAPISAEQNDAEDNVGEVETEIEVESVIAVEAEIEADAAPALSTTDSDELTIALSEANTESPEVVIPDTEAAELSLTPESVEAPAAIELVVAEPEAPMEAAALADDSDAAAGNEEQVLDLVAETTALASESLTIAEVEPAIDAAHPGELSEVSTSSEAATAEPAADELIAPEPESEPETSVDELELARQKAIAEAEQDAAALFGQAPTPVNTTQEMPVAAAPETVETPTNVVADSEASTADDSAAAALALSPTPDHPVVNKTGKAIFEAKPVHGQEEHVLDIPPPPVKKIDAATVPDKPAPAPSPIKPITETKPVAEPAPAAEKVAKAGLFGKIGEWKGHLSYLHSLYKEDPNTAVTHWKQTYKERDSFAQALKDLQERQTADNFAWEEIPRVLGQFHMREDDRGQADWYGDAARQYQAVLNAIEKQKTFKPQLVQPLMKELKFIAEADAFHQKFGLSAIQQKVKTMYQTLQQRIDEYMKLQKQQLEIASKDKEIEKLRAQEAIATAEAQKVAQENRLVQEQRLKVVEDKKRLEAKRAAEEAERVRLERQREIEAELAEARRREELSASFRAIEQEELMRKALQNMSLSQCAEGLLRQLFEKDQLSEQEKAAAARVLDVLKAKLS